MVRAVHHVALATLPLLILAGEKIPLEITRKVSTLDSVSTEVYIASFPQTTLVVSCVVEQNTKKASYQGCNRSNTKADAIGIRKSKLVFEELQRQWLQHQPKKYFEKRLSL